MRISFYAGPGCGKSTTASGIFFELKKLNCSVELVNEYIKKWCYISVAPTSFDQLYIFSKQLRAEDIILRSGTEHIVTDSPLFMQIIYAEAQGLTFTPELLEIARKWEREYPSLNIFLNRNLDTYQEEGRYHNLQQAIEFDEQIKSFLQYNKIDFKEIDTKDFDSILSFVKQSI